MKSQFYLLPLTCEKCKKGFSLNVPEGQKLSATSCPFCGALVMLDEQNENFEINE